MQPIRINPLPTNENMTSYYVIIILFLYIGSNSYPISAAVVPAVLLFVVLSGILVLTIVVLYKYKCKSRVININLRATTL